MRVTTVTYQKVFPIAAFINQKIGVEIQVDEGDSEDDAFSLAKQCVEEWNKLSGEVQLGTFDDKQPMTAPIVQLKEESVGDAEFEGLKLKVRQAETKEMAEEIVANAGNWRLPLRHQMKEVINQKPSNNAQ